ncbi:hypothetical protein MRX96_008555 [Rhipicephalus microplus]
MMCSRYSVFCFILQIAASLGNHYLHLHAPSKSHLCNAPFKRHDEAFNNSTCAKSSTLWDVPAATWCSPVDWSMISWPNCTRRGTAATPTWRQTDIKASSPTLPFSGSGSSMMCSRYSVFCFILQIAASLGNHYLHLHAPSKSHLCNAPFMRHDEAFNNSTCAKSSTLWDVPAATWCSPVDWSMISWPNCTRRGTAATPTWRQTDIKSSSPTLPFSGSGSGMMCSRYSVFCFILQIAASLGNHYLHLHAPSKSHLCNAPFIRHDEAFNNSTCAKSSTLWDVPAATWCSPVDWSMISWPNCTRRGTAATPTWRQTDIKASSPTLPFSGSGSGMMCSRYSVFCFILQIAASLGNHYLHLHAPSKSHRCNAPFIRHDEAFNNSTCAKSSTLWDVPAATWCSPVDWSMISWPNCTRRGTAATPTWRQTDIKASSPTLPFSGSGSGMMCSRYSVFCFILQIAASLGNHYLHLHAPSKSHLCNAPFHTA